jgi:hypothetical protein
MSELDAVLNRAVEIGSTFMGEHRGIYRTN